MPKSKLASVNAIKVQAKDKVFSIFGRDGAGREVEVELPLSSLTRISAETRRAAMSTPRPTSIPANAAAGEWGEVVPLDIRTAAVGTLQPPAGPAVGIVFDQGHDTELTFRIPPQTALELGKMLLAEGEKLKDAPPPQGMRKRDASDD
jgi:hypothetical protein